jgi:two-component system, cell cycle sensor histidine kinase and response regulator CckA
MGIGRQFRETTVTAEVPIRERLPDGSASAPTPVAPLDNSDKRYQVIFQAAAIGIFQCTMDGRVAHCNPAAERMLGYTREELHGMHFRDFTHPDDVGLDLQLFQEMVEGRRDYYQIELRSVRKDGSHGWVRLTVSLVRRGDGTPEFAIGMTEDITEQKRAEQQLREAQKMEAIGRLVGGVAHDFNNLLTGIMLYCDLLLLGLEKGSRLRHHAEEIRTAGEQGAALIQQLLAVVRQHVVEPRVLSLNEIVSGMTNLLARLIGENVKLETRLADGLEQVKIDPAQVKQIVMNLVLNARDAMPKGGHILVETRNCASAESATEPAPDAPCVALTVSDDGCGMDAETRARLFEPFFTTKAPGHGNGLGLATVCSIVRQNGGCINVESELGRGTEVTILLPKAEEEMEASTNLEGTVPQGYETVLLIDDNPQVRNSVQHILSECGYHVLEAATGSDALEIFESHGEEVDLLLADLAMPEMSGREVARKLRLRRPELKVMLITGYNRPELTATGDEGPFVLFRKPFTASALAQKVRQILDGGLPADPHENRG